MALVVLSLNQALEFSGIVRLGLDATLGGVLYVGTLMALWNLSGRPTAAAERDVVTLINHSLSMLGAIRARVLNAVQ
jgi:hypothetical protein